MSVPVQFLLRLAPRERGVIEQTVVGVGESEDDAVHNATQIWVDVVAPPVRAPYDPHGEALVTLPHRATPAKAAPGALAKSAPIGEPNTGAPLYYEVGRYSIDLPDADGTPHAWQVITGPLVSHDHAAIELADLINARESGRFAAEILPALAARPSPSRAGWQWVSLLTTMNAEGNWRTSWWVNNSPWDPAPASNARDESASADASAADATIPSVSFRQFWIAWRGTPDEARVAAGTSWWRRLAAPLREKLTLEAARRFVGWMNL
ncbi:MAG: DUF6348 family protein [Gemmatimonadota bacterium]|nr:DUF6348 family protein [Gemmatimonadota bacterium]